MMNRRSILRYGAILLATTGLAVGVAAASSIDTTGPNSQNKIEVTGHNTVDVSNQNHLGVNNNNDQGAWTGDAKVKDNTTGGDATSGDATNSNDVTTDVSVDNGSSCGCLTDIFGSGSDSDGSISNTGPDSDNRIEFKTDNKLEVHNDNNVTVNNNNNQHASSGDADVSHNTTGGDATTGSASNTTSSSTSVTISN